MEQNYFAGLNQALVRIRTSQIKFSPQGNGAERYETLLTLLHHVETWAKDNGVLSTPFALFTLYYNQPLEIQTTPRPGALPAITSIGSVAGVHWPFVEEQLNEFHETKFLVLLHALFKLAEETQSFQLENTQAYLKLFDQAIADIHSAAERLLAALNDKRV